MPHPPGRAFPCSWWLGRARAECRADDLRERLIPSAVGREADALGYPSSFPCGDFRPILVRNLRGMERSRRLLCQTHLLTCRAFTGATGLEPATSGVTGPSWRLRAEREWAGIPEVSSLLAVGLAGIAGCGRGRPAAFCGISAGCNVASVANRRNEGDPDLLVPREWARQRSSESTLVQASGRCLLASPHPPNIRARAPGERR
jgi:hypothetical protein